MINNELSNLFANLYNRNAKKDAAATSGDSGKAKGRDNAQAAADPAQAEAAKKPRRNSVDEYQRSQDAAGLTSEEKRRASIQKIMDKLDAEEAMRYPARANQNSSANSANSSKKPEQSGKTDETNASAGVTADFGDVKDKDGIGALLNDMPLFNEFKTSLMDAFRSMDGATSGSIKAQYELNYSSMQYIADAAGNYKYEETNFNIKLDLNYVKAGAGNMSGSEIADAIENADDFESFVAALQDISGKVNVGSDAVEGGGKDNGNGADNNNKNNPLADYLDSNGNVLSAKQLMNNAMKNMTPGQVMNGLKDYFAPEATAGRIVDFATAFFPMSEAYKKGGDTPEAREQFGEMMRDAINKGFEQAMGSLGSIPKSTQDGIDKTHELAMNGMDDFIKNGMDKQKEEDGVYQNLTDFAFSFEMSYSHKSASVSYYDKRGQAQINPTAATLNAEA